MKHAEWMRLATEEYARIITLLRDLDDDEWSRLTDCDPWTVRDIVAHLIGAAEATASIREQLRQQRAGKAQQGDAELMATVNALQIRERQHRSTANLVDLLTDAAARGVRARSALPAAVRMFKLRLPAPWHWTSLGYLYGPIYTRDAWVHRIDICRATGRELVVTAEHDGLIVADLIADRSAQAGIVGGSNIDLTGPAGGHFGTGSALAYDAIDFSRALAGRGSIDRIEPAMALF
ncbi:maleylpyruvate isomerase family mycothiol-dependent enzyme [Rathayibacter soli]|uniref:maleylpyruvate isomerase family mycothiol-dependent enzyme n=1 Tax=Rathayibacter soli TaxID=3144168 RepID=UPI0027E5882B|nr:maleylpyruvate isomerase family mycothiol-dependent enzyme [Glaciibacter superstes]